jgi:DNA-3-methyladenine glycosylase
MGITKAWTGTDLTDPPGPIWLEYGDQIPSAENIAESARIGVGYAEECAQWPWRFTIAGNPWLSR